ncbi:neocarzinostatin apoprotein domain-containing protein [Actinoplanes subglobosus]|uniref:Neocarzinostatin apoprotein domain-containing protein n=1 Tax=Actinoplanes subglobosus TaxID=1547892 RepID=A0ABV8IZU4_9ACTN
MVLDNLRRLAAAVAAGLVTAGAVLFVQPAPALAAAKLHVSKTTGIADGEKITVYGTGFTPGLTDLALGQCVKDPATATDCNLTGGAEFVSTDASGKTKTLTLTIQKSFSGKSCDNGCVVAAQLLPSSHSADEVAANKVQVTIKFGSGTATKTATATSTKSSAAAAADDSDALPKTGPGQEWATVVLIGSALLLPGAGLLLLLPARRRRIAGFR